MKNSTRRNIRRLITTFGVTLVVALAVSGVTGLFRGSLTEAARNRENNTLVRGSSAPDEASRERIAEAFDKLLQRFVALVKLSTSRIFASMTFATQQRVGCG